MKKLLVIFTFLIGFSTFSQKKVIDHTAYNGWKRVGETQISEDGTFSAYTIKPLRGDGYLYLVNNVTGKRDSFPRAVGPKFTSDNGALLFKINPGFDTLRNCELNKVKKDKWPKDSLGIYFLGSDSLAKIPKVKEYVVAENSGRFAYLSFDNKMTDSKEKKPKKKKKKKNEDEDELTSDGNLLVVGHSNHSGKTEAINVTDYEFSKSGEKIALISHRKLKMDSFMLDVIDLSFKGPDHIITNLPEISTFAFDKSENQLVYVASMDTCEENKVNQLYCFDLILGKNQLLLDTVQAGLDSKLSVSGEFTPYFSPDSKKIFFGLGDKPEKMPKDTLIESEKAKLDLWHWKDERLQPQQLIELSRDEKKSYLSVFDLNTRSFLMLENDSMNVQHQENNPSEFVLASNSKPYDAKQWEVPSKADYYRMNINTGNKELLRKTAIYQLNLSPKGDYYTYFNEKDSEQYLVQLSDNKEFCITCQLKAEWLEDVNGMPYLPGPLGINAWLKDNTNGMETAFLIQSKYDLFLFDLNTKKLNQLTNTDVAKKIIRYSISSWENDSIYFDFNSSYVVGFNEKDKSSSLFVPKWDLTHLDLNEKLHANQEITVLRKAKKGDRFLFQLSSLEKYPDIQVSTWEQGSQISQISFTNPQQAEYNWATVELISWKSYSGIPLDGLLYKPENYDPTKKYPLLVYFYELYSDEIHNHYAPKPTASIIYPTEYASAGYFVLIPDIRYTAGHPANGAYDCIMSGTDRVLKLYPCVDSLRMGLQGQSWGGYQTAQLVTMTSRYKAAMAGAPVGNMFSAYGGIRWGSGINRQFQYEHTQSRIGKTIWEAPELYVENSPLFHLPKVQTPLLIMHNDADGAVPWYQGIELFTGLRRLGKPVWMLNYNGDDHNLLKNANRIDLSIRLRQYFDHYLLNQAAPSWLEDGIPALDKGKKYGFDLK